jgi:CHASE2 domain-containing sensor protein
MFILIQVRTKLLDGLEANHLKALFYFRTETPVNYGPDDHRQHSVRINARLDRRVILIGIDEMSIIDSERYPWKRAFYAPVFNHLGQSKPEVFYCDIFFSERSDPANDTVFFDALRRYNAINRNLIMPFKFFVSYQYSPGRMNDKHLKKHESMMPLLDKFTFLLPANITKGNDRAYRYSHPVTPLPEIIKNSENIGVAYAGHDAVGTTRYCPLMVEYNGKLYPSVILQMAMKIMNVKRTNVIIRYGKEILLKNASVPVLNQYGEVASRVNKDFRIPLYSGYDMLINYFGYPGEFSRQSQYFNFLDASLIPPEAYNDKIVFLGVTDPNMNGDIWPSPLGPMPGVEHMIWALNTILTKSYLREINSNWENILIVTFCLIFSLLIQVLKPFLIIPSLPFFILLLYGVNVGVFCLKDYIFHYWPLFLSIVFIYPVQIFWRFYPWKRQGAGT